MSLKDLDESHQRKQQLLSSAPLGGSLWDEPETSKAASNRAALGAAAPIASTNAKPTAVRKESSKSNKSSRKLFGGGGDKPAQRAVPARSTSTQDVKGTQVDENSVSKAVPTNPAAADTSVPTSLPPAVTAAQLGGNPSAIRESMESSGRQFETPNGSSSELADAEDGDKTLTANGNGNGQEHSEEVPESKNLSVETAMPASTADTEPVTPRTVTEPGEGRSVTPTPQDAAPASTS